MVLHFGCQITHIVLILYHIFFFLSFILYRYGNHSVHVIANFCCTRNLTNFCSNLVQTLNDEDLQHRCSCILLQFTVASGASLFVYPSKWRLPGNIYNVYRKKKKKTVLSSQPLQPIILY